MWPAPTKSGHINHDSLKLQHRNGLRLSEVRPFDVYSIRHIRNGMAPFVDAWAICRIMGWASISMGMRYDHTSEERVPGALARIPVLGQGGDKSGDSDEIVLQVPEVHAPATN